MRLPIYAELRRFAEGEGWENRDAARGGRTGDHFRYVFTAPDGDRLYTRVSHGRGQVGDPDLFAYILGDQLKVTVEQFWDAVDRGQAPSRPRPGIAVEQSALDAKLARNLASRVGMRGDELAGLSEQDAVRIWQDWLAAGGSSAP